MSVSPPHDPGLSHALWLAALRYRLPPPTTRRHLREACGITRHSVAAEVGVTVGAIGHYEMGRRTPDGDVLVRYSAVLDRLAAEAARRS